MTQKTTLTIPRFVELVGAWITQNGFSEIGIFSYRKSYTHSVGYISFGEPPDMSLMVQWAKDNTCADIMLFRPGSCFDTAHHCSPTEAGLLDALTELAERLRGEK